MRDNHSLEEKRKVIIDYIKRNPRTHYREIRSDTRLHPERLFESLKEAFVLAGVKVPRNFDFKTKEERRKIIIKYIEDNPGVGGQTIAKETKINVASAFKNLKEAYEAAGVKYPRNKMINSRKRTDMERKEEIIAVVKDKPFINIEDIAKITRTNPYRLFKNINQIYEKANIKKVKSHQKTELKKKQEVINFIKKNPLSTQRDINKSCKTHVQDLFNKGIFEAYSKAGVRFPFERLRMYGVGLKKVRKRAKAFEEKIAVKISGYGNVNRLVKTKRGIIDIVLERKNNKAIIEVKDYMNKEISKSQIKQLERYLNDYNCHLGFLICHEKPKKDRFLRNKNKIFLLEEQELNKIPILMDRVYSSTV